jgi:hypothetical protein
MLGSPYQPKTILRVSLPLSGKYSHTHTHIFTKYPLPYSNFSVLESGKLTRLFQGQKINLIYMKAECVTESYTHIQWSYLILYLRQLEDRQCGKVRARKGERVRKRYRVGEWEGGRHRRKETTDEIQKKWKHWRISFYRRMDFDGRDLFNYHHSVKSLFCPLV